MTAPLSRSVVGLFHEGRAASGEVLMQSARRRAAQIAEDLSAVLGKAYTEEGLRQLLHRARLRFAELLVAEVAHSLQTTDQARLEQEVIELGLLKYCRAALARRR